MSRIQKSPAGYLSLLSMIGSGQNPAEAFDSVQPTVDLSDLYASRDIAIEQITGAAISAGGTEVVIPVPTGQAWYMLGMGALLSTHSAAAGQLTGVILRVRPGSALQNLPLKDSHFFPGVANTSDEFQSGFWFPTRWVAPPGTQFVAALALTTVQTMSLTLRVMFHRLQV